MKFIELLKTAWQSLKVNPKRSFLTMIGIIIGISDGDHDHCPRKWGQKEADQ